MKRTAELTVLQLPQDAALRSSQGRAEGPPQPLLLRVPTTAWDPPLSAASFTPTLHGDSPISPQTSPFQSRRSWCSPPQPFQTPHL